MEKYQLYFFFRSNSGGLMSRTHKNTNASNMFREVLRNYEKQEKMGLYSVNIEEMRRLKEIQNLKSLNLSQPKRKNIPFQKLLENANSLKKKL